MIWAVSLSTTNLIARSLTATLSLTGIRSLVDVSNLVGPISHPVLYLRQETRDAAPKCISGRTSYHRFCLSFHPYPQLIPQVFNPGGFGPPRGLTRASTWPWVDHSASGLEHATRNALFGLAFATASPHGLTSPRTTNSQAHSSKGTQSPPPHEATIRLSRLVGTRFQVLFHSPPGVLFTFPSRYLSAIGHQGVFRLSGWSRQIHTEFHGLGATWEHVREDPGFRVRGSHPLRRPLPEAFH